MKNTVSVTLLILLLTSMLTLALNIQPAEADAPTIYINVDGSITPVGAPIVTSDNITYTFSGNISYPTYSGVVVERSNVVINGNGYTVQGYISTTELYDLTTGLNLTETSDVTIENTNIKDFYYGIYLDSSSNNTVSGNNVTTNNEGILLANSSTNNVISGNEATANNYDGIYLDEASNNTVSDDNATTNNVGIFLYQSPDNVLFRNVIEDNKYSFGVVGDFMNLVDTSNLVNGKPVYYMISKSNLVIDPESYPNIGYLALVNCTNMTVQGLTFTGNGHGILLALTNDSRITNNNLTNDFDGIYLDEASNNTVSGNNATANSYGIQLVESSGNTVGDNIVTENYDGFDLEESSSNIVSGNDAAANNYAGIYLVSSSKNIIYHNSFNGNVVEASVDSASVGNVWDDGYPSGGNYWSDYNGTDLYGGPYQNLTGSDGIGDTPYTIDVNNTDYFPLMGMFSSFSTLTGYPVNIISNSTISGFAAPIWLEHPEIVTLTFNVTGANGSTGFCRVSFPTAMMNGTYDVTVNGTEVPYILLPCSNANSSYLYFTYKHSTEQVIILPEFPSFLILALFMVTTLLIIMNCKKTKLQRLKF